MQGQYLLEWAAIFGDYGISHQLVADSGQNSVFCSVLCNGYFYKKILEKYVDRIPSVVYFAIVFAAKLMIFFIIKLGWLIRQRGAMTLIKDRSCQLLLVFGNCTLDADCNDNGTSIWKKKVD